MTIYVKKYNGSAWVDGAIKKYDGSNWVDAYTYRWTGSEWEQIYPEVAITTTETITGYENTYSYRVNRWKNWKLEDAKQGNGEPYDYDPNNSSTDADSHHIGYLNLNSNLFTGYQAVNSVSEAYFTATRGGAGKYNTDQTINFYRSDFKVTADTYSSLDNPSSSLAGNFTCKTGAPGSGGSMSNKTISALSNCKNWMNAVGGKNRLYIDDTTKDNYLSIKGPVKIKSKYTYLATAAVYLDAQSLSLNAFQIKKSDLTDSDIYHKMFLYPSESGMTLDEVVRHRELNNLPDISPDNVVDGYIPEITILDSIVDNDRITVHLTYLQDCHVPEYSIDGVVYHKLQSDKPDFYYGLYNDKDFNPYMNNIYIRVRNVITDSIDFTFLQEPRIKII